MKTRILHLELGRHLYGGAKQVTYLIKGLDKSTNFEQHLLCTHDSEIRDAQFTRCLIHPIRYSGEVDILGMMRILKEIKRLSPHIIHVHSRRGADVIGALAAKLYQIPAICTRRVDNLESRFAFYKYRQYTGVVSISKGVSGVVSMHCEGVKHQKVIPSAVDTVEYGVCANQTWFRREFAIPKGHKVIANFAQYISRKGQADIILAMREVLKKNSKVTCLLFGQGALKESYQALIDRHNLAENVRLCEFTNNVAKILPNIDMLVHPAYAEGLGVILLQAGINKCPIISCPVGGIPEIIKHKETGLMVAPGDIQGLGESIMYLLEHPDIAKTYGEAVSVHVREVFSIDKMTASYADLYQSVYQ